MSKFTRTAVVAALIISLAGCGAGQGAETLKPYTPTDGVQASAQDIKVRNVVLVSMPDGTGVLVGTFINTGPTQDRITGIVVNGIPAVVTPASPVLDQNAPIRFAGESTNASANIPGLGAAPGTLAKVEITFQTSGTLKLDVIVRDNTHEYSGVTLTPTQG